MNLEQGVYKTYDLRFVHVITTDIKSTPYVKKGYHRYVVGESIFIEVKLLFSTTLRKTSESFPNV